MAWFGQKGDKDLLKKLLKKGKVLLAREVRYKNYTKNSYQFRVVKRETLLEMKGNLNLYEVIAYKPGFHAKLFFDHDKIIDINEFCSALYDLGITESIILDASLKPKFSVHMICNRIFQSVYHIQSWILDVLLIKYPNLKLDLSVYTKDRCFRLEGNSKLGSERVLINKGVFCNKTGKFIRKASFSDSLIMTEEDFIPYDIPKIPVNKVIKRGGHKEKSILNIPRDTTLDFYTKNLPLQSDRLTWIKICCCLKGLGATHEDIWKWDSRLKTESLGLVRSKQDLKEQFSRFTPPKGQF